MLNNIFDLIKFNLLNNLLNNRKLEQYISLSNIFMVSLIYFMFIYYNTFYNFYKQQKYSHIIIEGSRSINYSRSFCRYDNLFSTRFRAIWHYIQKNMKQLNIKSIKEITNETAKYNDYGDYLDNENKESDIFYINQTNSFKISDNIYCKVDFNNSHIEDSNNNNSNKNNNIVQENITLDIFSNYLTVYELNSFIDNLVIDFEKFQNKSRKDKLFIYTLSNSGMSSDHFNDRNREKNINWDELEFKSNKTFDKLFFNGKQDFINKINFFINNEDYYNKYGIPYTLGISLEGHPGTGKTSIIKCLANYLNRHLVVINLNKIKTCDELNKIFYENTYSYDNVKNSINFKEKIYVFEDIDCCMKIVKQRKTKKKKEQICKNKNKSNNSESNEKLDLNSESNSESNLESNLESNSESNLELNSDSDSNSDSELNSNKSNIKYKKRMNRRHMFEKLLFKESQKDDKLTLGYILNLFDGIKECPGRIIIITSNFMDKIDYALKRPGRIDINIKMDYIDSTSLNQFYEFYYNKSMNENLMDKYSNIYNYKLTPANLTNIFINTEENLFEIKLDYYLKTL